MPIPADPARQLLPPSPTGPADRAHPLPPPGLTGPAHRTSAVPLASPTGGTRPLPTPLSPAGPAHRTRRLPPSGLTARTRRLLPPGLTGLAALACAACCAIPLLLTAGVLSGATWAVAVSWLPGTAAALTALAAAAWWRTTHNPHRARCTGGTCSCATP
ncbi:hypothetical protein ACQP2Y_32460 [Actinoplanes sp. CA-051413]|uniref:hypothetical protein n=1 Tax=Actinoplanes sp. CA-051413 TaxID=3239899 RepID=UPI003D968457